MRKYLVIEEKQDGVNIEISFDQDDNLRLQCRRHFLVGGADEEQFALFKTWAQCHQD